MKKFSLLLLTLGLALPVFAQTKTLLNLDTSGVAIQGYDPGRLFHRPQAGERRPEICGQARWRDLFFRLEGAQGTVQGRPGQIRAGFGGYCAYGVSRNKLVEIDVNAFQIVDGKLLLQYSKGVRDDFNKDAKGNLAKARRQLARPRRQKGKITCKRTSPGHDQSLHLMESLTKTQRIVSWVCRITAAVILLQTLFFKFTGAPGIGLHFHQGWHGAVGPLRLRRGGTDRRHFAADHSRYCLGWRIAGAGRHGRRDCLAPDRAGHRGPKRRRLAFRPCAHGQRSASLVDTGSCIAGQIPFVSQMVQNQKYEHESTNEDRELIQAVIETLRQGETLLTEISDEAYTRKVPVAFNASIGGHYRHCLDHFRSLLDAAAAGDLNYDHRERGTLVETDRFAALNATRELREGYAEAGSGLARRARLAVTCKTSYATSGSQTCAVHRRPRDHVFRRARRASLRADRRHGRNHGIDDAARLRRRAVHAQASGARPPKRAA